MSGRDELLQALRAVHPGVDVSDAGDRLIINAPPERVPAVAVALSETHRCEFATLVVEECGGTFKLNYFFHNGADGGALIQIKTTTQEDSVPTISDWVHAADWHEREAEDLFGIRFEGHPFAGDFVLHDAVWPQGVTPMRREFNAASPVEQPGLGAGWHPRRILHQEGSVAFPVGPIWADYNEAGLWLLETPGEHIYQCQTRLFYKYRAVEKIAEGGAPERGLRLAERFSGNSAFAHGWAYCRALEKIARCEVPPRARALRTVLAELERIRYHAAVIAEIAGSTSLAVGKSMSQEIEERMLRLAGELCGHRYLFGLCTPGGLAWEPGTAALANLRTGLAGAAEEFARLERLFVHTSSHLDRLEEMGTLHPDDAELYGVVGPVARASNRRMDLRHGLPYGVYATHVPEAVREIEGDGYARQRVFFAEIRTSMALIQALVAGLPDGPVAGECAACPGAALAWVEAPAGAAFHWLRVDDAGRIARWSIAPPAYRNWHAFHRSLGGAAFQDFHIVLASFGLSVAEADR